MQPLSTPYSPSATEGNHHVKIAKESGLFVSRIARRVRSGLNAGLLVALGAAAGMLFMYQREPANTSVVTINGVSVSGKEFYHRLESVNAAALLQSMVNDELTLQFAQKQGAMPTAAQVDAKLAQARQDPNYAKNLAATLQTEDNIRHNLTVNLAKTNVYTKGITITDEEVRAFYVNNIRKNDPKSLYYVPQTVTVGIIVNRSLEDSRKALAELARGVQFTQVARRNSNDSSAAKGGLLPPIRRGQTDLSRYPGLEARLFQMSPGDQTEPTRFGDAWLIIRCADVTPEICMPFDKVRDDCREGALTLKGTMYNGEQVKAAYERFRKEADIKVNWTRYKTLLNFK